MTEHDVVRRYLIDRGCPDALVDGGLAGLGDKWEAIVASIEGGYPFGLDDYLNDMDLRDTIAGAMAVATPDERATLHDRLEALDARFRAVTVPSPCLWGDDVEEDDGLDPGREWWYYQRPARPSEELSGELAAWGLLNHVVDGDDTPGEIA